MPLSRRCSELVGRAQLASLLAERAFRPTEDLPYEGGVAVGCELSRQGAYWVLSAHREHWAPESPLNAGTDSRPADSLDTLWSSADRELPEQAAGSSAQLERLSADVLGKSFTDFAELAASKQTELAARLHAFSVRLTEPLLAPQRELERAWVRRLVLFCLGLVVLVALAYTVNKIEDAREFRSDLAPQASWKASPHYATCSCKSPQQVCDACPDYFFCTLEENQPSIVFDLRQEQSHSKIIVENRRDCCGDRTVPLFVQVSSDRAHWQTVASRLSSFTTWRERFPTVRARDHTSCCSRAWLSR